MPSVTGEPEDAPAETSAPGTVMVTCTSIALPLMVTVSLLHACGGALRRAGAGRGQHLRARLLAIRPHTTKKAPRARPASAVVAVCEFSHKSWSARWRRSCGQRRVLLVALAARGGHSGADRHRPKRRGHGVLCRRAAAAAALGACSAVPRADCRASAEAWAGRSPRQDARPR